MKDFMFCVMSPTMRRADMLMAEYYKQYPDEIVRVYRFKHEIIQDDGTIIKFVSENEWNKLKGYRCDIYTERGFKEMYQVR